MRGGTPQYQPVNTKSKKILPANHRSKIFIFKRNKGEPEPRKKCPTFSFDKIKINVKGSGEGARSTQTKMPGVLANLGHLLLLRDRFLRRSGSAT